MKEKNKNSEKTSQPSPLPPSAVATPEETVPSTLLRRTGRGKRIESLDELDKLCRETIDIEFTYSGKPVSVAARRLTPAEDARINLILQEVRPKLIPGQRPGEYIQDPHDTEYPRKLAEARITARAITLFLCVSLFHHRLEAGATDIGNPFDNRSRVTEFVQGKFTEDVLQLLYDRIVQGGISLEDRINFS